MAFRPQTQKVLLLGASGKLGRMMRHIWTKEQAFGFDVIPVFRRKLAKQDGVFWSAGDPVGVLPRVDSVVALWGVTRGDPLSLAQNSELALVAMDLAARLGARRVLHCSSAAVYRPGPLPLSEDTLADPVAPYGHAKLAMEQVVLRQAARSPDGPQQVVMRIGNVAGADSLFANMRPHGELRLDQFPDGSGPQRSYIAPDDLARVIKVLCLAQAVSPVVNVAAPESTAMADLAQAAASRVVWHSAPDTAAQMVHLDCTRLMRLCPMPAHTFLASHLVASAQSTGLWP